MTIHDNNGTGLAIIDAEHHLVPTTAIEVAGDEDAEDLSYYQLRARRPAILIPSDESFAGKAYLDAPQLQALGIELIETKARFSHLRGMRIEFLWKRKGTRKSGIVQRGFCRLASDLIGFYAEVDFVVGLCADVCLAQGLDQVQIEAALHHELMHAGAHEETNVPMLWPHDFEGFGLEIEDYGLWTAELRTAGEMFRQMRLFPNGGPR